MGLLLERILGRNESLDLVLEIVSASIESLHPLFFGVHVGDASFVLGAHELESLGILEIELWVGQHQLQHLLPLISIGLSHHCFEGFAS